MALTFFGDFKQIVERFVILHAVCYNKNMVLLVMYHFLNSKILGLRSFEIYCSTEVSYLCEHKQYLSEF